MTMRNDDATLKNNLPPNIITVIERGDDRIANGYLIRERDARNGADVDHDSMF